MKIPKEENMRPLFTSKIVVENQQVSIKVKKKPSKNQVLFETTFNSNKVCTSQIGIINHQRTQRRSLPP